MDSGLQQALTSVAGVSVGFTLMVVSGMIGALNVIDELAGGVAMLVLYAYPVFATLFTIYRRIVVHTLDPGLPDVAYLLHLVYKQLGRRLAGSPLTDPRARRNALRSPYLWLITSMGVLSTVPFWNRAVPLMMGALCFAALYVFGYARLARFGSPGWLIVRRGRASGHE